MGQMTGAGWSGRRGRAGQTIGGVGVDDGGGWSGRRRGVEQGGMR